MDHPQQPAEGSHFSHSGVTGSQIRLGAFMEGAVRDDEHRGGE